MLFHFHCIKLKHVLREANVYADWLARNGNHQSLGFQIFHHFPFDLLHFMYQDLIGLSSQPVIFSRFINENFHPLLTVEASLAGLSTGGAISVQVQPT